MKESITKFDLEAAFKALDDIEIPVANKVKANRPALTEIFSRKSKLDALIEEYYDISSMSELDDAKEAREAEVAQAKLARIEKIVDLDAESPEDLLPSYVGKFIVQCPQCMTLFYKNPEDVENSEEDPNTVNVSEICQHCGNEAGYTMIGKVGEVSQEEYAEYTEEEAVDVTSTEEAEDEEVFEEPVEDSEEDFELDAELDELDLNIEDEEDAEKKEESFETGTGEQLLVEQLTEEADLDVSADEFEELINSPEFKKPISDNETRAMMQDEEPSKDSKVEESYNDAEDRILDQVEDLLYCGKLLRARWTDGVPRIKRIDSSTYRVIHNSNSDASVIVKFKPTTDGSYDFTVNGEHCATRNMDKAQEFILDKLQIAHAKLFDIDLDESLEVNNETLRYAVINPDGTYAGVPCTSEEEARELAAQKEGRIIVELGALKEGIFDSKEKKQKVYAEAIKQVFGKDASIVANETITVAVDLVQEVADKVNDDGDKSKALALGVIKLINNAKVTINKTPHSLVKSIISIGQKYERDSLNLKELIDFNSKVGKLQNSSKDGYKAMEFLFSKLNPTLVKKLDLTVSVLKREFGIVESCDTSDGEPLEEGILDKIKDKFANTIDNIASKLKSREAKADWVLTSAMEDYDIVQVDNSGRLVPDEKNQRFHTFIVIGFKDKYSNGKVITTAPSFSNKELVPGMKRAETPKKYENAEKIAKGWSMRQGNGPAFIYLAKSPEDKNAVFLCEYFRGELEYDQLEKYFNVVKKDLAGAKLMASGKMVNQVADDDQPAEAAAEQNESFNAIMSGLEDLQEASLEKLISDSLVEAYGNVAGFRLAECTYLNEQFTVDGTIYFTSGNTRKTTYNFTEASKAADGKISISGLNEKLGLDKRFTMTGHADATKTFITESFTYVKM
jgi:hypothetical protein